MRSLQEIWDKIGGLETQVATQQPQILALQQQNKLLHSTAGTDFPWKITTVDNSAANVGSYNSICFGPDGQPAISYLDGINANLKFARKGVFPPAP